MYQRNGSVWQQTAKLIAAIPAGGEFLSRSIALSGNKIALGAPYANSGNLPNSGGVDTFEFDGTNWIRKPRIIPPNLLAEQNFGTWGLAFSGAALLVGVPQHRVNNQTYGSMFHFKPAGPANNWTYFQRSEAYDNVAGQYFGESIEVSGETIMVSARAHNSNRGAAYLLFDGIFLKDGFESL